MSADNSPQYHVLLEGRSMGPYDRRTIVGMRIKNTLSSEQLLIDSNGAQLTVGDLLGRRLSQNGFNASRSGAYSIVRATYAAGLLGVAGYGYEVPAFRDEIEVRVQGDVVRIAGRFRVGVTVKEDRIKIPLMAVTHARAVGSRVDLWVRGETMPQGAPLQRISLELFETDVAGELLEWLPAATPPPPALAAAAGQMSGAALMRNPLTWVAITGVLVVLGVIAFVLRYIRAI